MSTETARPAPYPSDTRSKGWRFEVDMETVKASDTWLKARTGAIRGALLLLWSEAWQQSPCGTLPNDDELIALLIDMPPATFAKNRTVLMRGWWLASDGRLYHETITTRVLAMLDKRANDAQRAATRRARKAESSGSPPGITQESRVTHGGVGDESDTKHQAPSTREKKSPKPPAGADGDEKEPAKPKSSAVGLKAWLEAVKARGEKPIPPEDPVFAYAKSAGIPDDFLTLAWLEFRHRYTQPDAKLYRDWRAVFRKAVRGGWLKLWYVDQAGAYALTTVGIQAQRSHDGRRAA